MQLVFLDDPGAFLDVAAGWLAADPVVTTVVSSQAHRAATGTSMRGQVGTPEPWWLVVRDSRGAVVGAGMRTQGFPPYLLPMPIDAARQVGRRSSTVARPSTVPTARSSPAGRCSRPSRLASAAR